MVIRRKKEKFDILEFEQLQEFSEIVHAVYLKPVDAREDPLHPLVESLGISSYSKGHLVHGNCVVHISSKEETPGKCDGLITKMSDIALITTHADCQATLFYDPINRAIASVHCGWRSNVANIYKNTVKEMKCHFGSRPEDLLVCVGPSLGPNRSEFINYQTEIPIEYHRFQFKPFYFDLWEISRFQLEEAGILSHHIEIAKICTFENKGDFFSYRREGIKAGRHVSLIALRPN